jgi:glycosyltransferase involved in cell wall biosynthesis
MPDSCPPPLRIGFNAALFSPTRDYRAAGVHRYIAALLDAAGQIDDLCFTVLVPRAAHAEASQRWPAHDVRAAPAQVAHPTGRVLWEQLVLPAALRRARVDVYHGPAYALPLAPTVPAVVTVHDLSFLRLPETFPRAQGAYLRVATRRAVRRAEAVVAVSEFTRRELVDLVGADPARVYCVPNGCDPACRPLPAADVEAWRAAAGLPARFILTVGTLQPRKNLGTLLDAYARLRGRLADAPDLVIAGAPGWGDEDLGRRAQALGIGARVRFTGYVPGESLPLLYNAATLFALPSRYEGFGLPVVEAMASGTPVIVAAAGSLPEVAGGAGVVVDPLDAEAWASALAALLADAGRRAALGEAGLARAARFTWDRAVRETAQVYRRARAGRAGRAAARLAEARDG